MFFHGHVVRLAIDHGRVGKDAVWGTDRTPMWCYGAVIGTLRRLGGGVRKPVRRWAQATKQGVDAVAKEWALSALIAAKSTKGGLGVEIRDEAGRAKALDGLADAVMKAVAYVREHAEQAEVAPAKRKKLFKLARRLLLVITQNLDRQEVDGAERWVMAHKAAPERLASLTDPEARHGRRSSSPTYTGFKPPALQCKAEPAATLPPADLPRRPEGRGLPGRLARAAPPRRSFDLKQSR